MPARQDEFVAHCLELLAPLGSARARRMFGGHGIYIGDVFVALIAFERLYLKVDAHTRARFEEVGCASFAYEGKGKPIVMSYWSAPDDALESPASMRPWAQFALEAALRARSAKRISGRQPPTAGARSRATSRAGAKARR